MEASTASAEDSPGRGRATGMAPAFAGVAVVSLLLVAVVVGAAAEQRPGSAQLRVGPTSALLSVVVTLAVLTGGAMFAILAWSLVTGGRRRSEASQRRRSPLLAAAASFGVLTVALMLFALAARHRHLLRAPRPAGSTSAASAGESGLLHFNATASASTVGVVGVLVIGFVALAMARRLAWRRAGWHLWRSSSSTGDDVDTVDHLEPIGELSREFRALSIPDPTAEPDARRVVFACYLQMLSAADRAGASRRADETPGEYLGRLLAWTGVSEDPATTLTVLFERARYSERPVDESMRDHAVIALGSVQHELEEAPERTGARRLIGAAAARGSGDLAAARLRPGSAG